MHSTPRAATATRRSAADTRRKRTTQHASFSSCKIFHPFNASAFSLRAKNTAGSLPEHTTGDNLQDDSRIAKHAIRSGCGSARSHPLGIAVGTPVARRPPHRSRRAVFPHRALQDDSLTHAPPDNAPPTVLPDWSV